MKKKFLLKIFPAAILFILFSNLLNAQTVLPLDSTLSGTVVGAQVNTYSVTIPGDGILAITLTNTYGLSQYGLYDNDNTTGLGRNPDNNYDYLSAGTYYVRVQSYYGNDSDTYTISAHFTPVPVANDIEPNDDTVHAQHMPTDSTTTGHIGYYYNHYTDNQDFYKITTNEDGMLTLQATPDSTVALQFSIFDSRGSAIATNALDGLSPDSYYVEISRNQQLGFGAYTFTDSLKTYNYAADAEPNNAPYQAGTLPANGGITGHVGFYYPGSNIDGADWWKLNYNGDGNLKLTFKCEHQLSTNVNSLQIIEVYSDTTAGPIFAHDNNGNNGTDTVFVFNLTSLAQGTYWIKIHPYNQGQQGQFESYALQDSFAVSLPVTFLNFDGVIQNNIAMLEWSTVNEINNKGFEVEKSLDGQNFVAIGFVKSQGNLSNVNNYTFSDAKLLSGKNFYRLKQIDNDGKFNYSSVVKLDFSKFSWSVSGNPSQKMWVQVQLNKSANVSVQIFNINGQILQTINKGNISQGNYSIPLNLNKESAGMYVVKLTVDNQTYSKQIIK